MREKLSRWRKSAAGKKSLIAMVDKMEEDIDNPDGQIVYVGHGDAPEEAEYVAGLIRERFPTVRETSSITGPVIGAHSGPGTVNIHYVGKQRVDIKFK